MKNKLFEEEKPFFLGYLIFGTFMKRWPDRLKVLQKRKEENPVIADEIDAAIKKTEASMAEFKDAAEKYKAAAKKAKEQYDNQSGVKGKVKGFFGLEQADPDKKIFDLSPIPSPMFVFTGGAEGPKIGGEKFSMNDILSPDFNIGLFHKRGKLEGELLKKKVLGELFSFREYYDPKSSSKISNEEIEGIQDETLDTFNPFEVFNPAQQESLIKENEEPSGTMLEIKNICKPKAQKAFTKFQQSMKSNPTEENLTRQSKLLINNPYYAIYRNFGGYGDGQKQLIKRFPEILEKVLGKVYEEVFEKPIDSLQPPAAKNLTDWLAGPYTTKTFSNVVENVFTDITKADKVANKEAEEKQIKTWKSGFDKAIRTRLKELQKGIPLYMKGAKTEEYELTSKRKPAEVDKVYSDTKSFVMKWYNKNLDPLVVNSDLLDELFKVLVNGKKTEDWHSEIRRLQEADDSSDTLQSSYLGFLSLADELIKARDKEARRDLTALANYAKTRESKANSPNTENSAAIFGTLKKNKNDAILRIYKFWHDWLDENKKELLIHFEGNPPEADAANETLEEQIIKLIKPLLREKFKRKQNG